MADYLIHLATMIGIWSILAVSLELVVGYAGLLSIAQAAFCGIGAYTTALLLTVMDVNFFISILVAAIAAGMASFAIGIVLNKFRGDYYALGSFGFSTIVFSIFLNCNKLTNGALGISGIFRPKFFGVNFYGGGSFLFLVLLVLGIIFIISRFVANSSFGRVLKAIREDEEAAQAFGYNTKFLNWRFLSSALRWPARPARCLPVITLTSIPPVSKRCNRSLFWPSSYWAVWPICTARLPGRHSGSFCRKYCGSWGFPPK